jgi:hypothetical protein
MAELHFCEEELAADGALSQPLNPGVSVGLWGTQADVVIAANSARPSTPRRPL